MTLLTGNCTTMERKKERKKERFVGDGADVDERANVKLVRVRLMIKVP